MHDALFDRIRPVTRRMRSVRLWRLLACIATILGIIGLVIYARGDASEWIGAQAALVLLISGIAFAVGAMIVAQLSYRNPRRVATEIENHFPSLKQRLLTALSQPQNDAQLGYLQRRVIKEARDHSRTHRWTDVVPAGRLFLSRISGLAATAFLAVILGLLAYSERTLETTSATSVAELPTVIVAPGNAEVERGSSLVITARFAGIAGDAVPDEAELICTNDDGSQRRITMTQNLDDPVVGGFVASINQAFQYQVVTPSWQSENYSVDVFEFPTLVRSDANLKYPEYTALAEKRVEDTVRVSAVEGTEVTWFCFLNKPVESAELVGKDGTRMTLQADPELPGAYSAKFELWETQRMTLELLDDANRKNKYPPELVARVLPNQPPKLKLTNARDATVSPLEELSVGIEVRDDFGVANVGLAYSFATRPMEEIILGSSIARGTNQKIEHLIEFEALEAEPDQLLSYYFWAEDHGPDGELRRSESDMFFAEVRPFEEIFREGQPPPGGQQQQQQQQQSQNGQQAEQLAELQKEIINATWTVIRQERGEQRTPEFADNATLLKESQADALAQLEELAGEIEDERSMQFVDLVRGHMQTALAEFTKASDDHEVDPLSPAMAAAQASYAGLLKLRAREFEVTQQQQQQQQGQPQSSGAQRRQQQLDELELDQDENRYETQQQAEENSQEAEQQREVRQVLNRLRELARRQEDLNKELAQLQSALEQAETEKEREEIERQLKRLRDQQQDLLRETDELAERMQQPENQEQMSEASEQLEETRENVRRASEALEENDASEALTAGKRAEREFEEMRDEFRRQAAGEFNDAVREMRNDAQQLDQNQEELAEQLGEIDKEDPSQGLRGPDPRKEIAQQLQTQREQLAELLDKMQETVEAAEAAEPLLAQKLYDSFRRTQQRQVDRRLQDTEELVRRGYDPEAREMEKQAGEGIDQLREELEEAATSVLGDETEALQRALSELERLEQSLDQELQQNAPQERREQQPQEGQQPGQGQSQDGQQQDGQQPGQGQPQEGQQPSEQPQDGQPQDGQPQDGQPQDGQPQDGQQPGQGQPQEGQQPGEQSQDGQPPGQQPQQGQQPGQQPGQGQPQPGEQPGQGQPQEGQQPGEGQQQADQQGQQGDQPGSPNQQRGLLNQYAAENPDGAPLTGDGFREWSDRLRDVEEMVEDPELRSRAARIRDRAREVRVDFKRHSKDPQWNLVDQMIAQPLRELKRDVSEELLRRSAEKHAPVPIDRDPVPSEFADAVRQYYESLGSGR